MGYLTPLLLAAFLASATAGPAGQRHTCATSCSDATKFAYERGRSYEYDYTVTTTTENFPMDQEDKATMTATSKATINVHGPCEYSLTLSDVVLEGSSHSSEFSSEVTKKPLRFAFDDGHISEVCSQMEEPAWVTNFKRGVLSTFQNKMSNLNEDQRVTEVDITGECETDYKITQSGDESVTIDRSKSFSSCSRLATSAHTTLPTPLQRLPLFSAEQSCTQNIEAGILQVVNCREVLLVRPVSSGTEGAATTIIATLALKNTKPGIALADNEITKSTLEFDNSFDSNLGDGYFRKIETILNELDEKSHPVLSPEIPSLFSELVQNLRQLDERQLNLLYQANKATPVWRFLIDAAPMVVTSASTAIVTQLIKTGQMTAEEADIWFTSLAFVPNPEAEMFATLPTLMMDHPSKKSLLGVSAMINAYCIKDTSCMEHDSVREVLTTIEINLGTACRSSTLDEKQNILITLKALGNAGNWMNSETMRKCYSEPQNPAEVRVAALEAWRRAPCNYDRSGLMDIYLDTQEDSELRIAAYLSLMSCPTEELIDNVKDRLTSESVNQVGSFVWTHLSNLQETASHEKQWIRQLIGEDMLTNKFNVSTLKFSRNYESSFYMEEQGFGMTMDSNIIFSKRSFLPRSGMFNLSLDFFGESLNMLEVGGRIQGFEAFVEKFFGTDGYYPEETVEAILKNLRKSGSNQDATLEEMLDVVTDEPEGSYYVRVFGNDVQYNHFRGIENFFEKKPEFDLVELIMEFARKGNVDYTKSYKLIDTEFIYPTLSGMPLTLKINSTATVGLRMNGKFNAHSFKDVDIEGHIYPSASIQADTTVFIDAHVTKFGRKMTANVHTSSFLDGKLRIAEGKVIDMSLEMPHDKIELVDFKSEKIFIEHGEEVRIDDDENYQRIDCSDTGITLGAELCTQTSSSKYETKASVFILKTDSHTSYNFRFLKEHNSISLLIDTPESAVDRKISFVGIKDDQMINVDIHTPWKSIKATGGHVLSDNGKSLEMELVADSLRSYQMSAGYMTTQTVSSNKVENWLKIESPLKVIVDSRLVLEKDNDLSIVQINLQNGGLLPLSFKFSGSASTVMQKMDVQLISPVLTASASGSVNPNDGYTTQLAVKYSFMDHPEQSLTHYMKLKKVLTDEERTYTFALMQHMTQVTTFNINTKGRFSFTQGRIETSGSLNYGTDMFDLTTDNMISYAFEEGSKSYDVRMTLTSSSHNIDALLTEKFKLMRNYLLREAYLRITPAFELRSKTELGYSGDIEGFARVQVSMPSFDMSHEWSYTKIANKYYTAKVLGKLNDHHWKFDGSYQDRSLSGQSVDYVLSCNSRLNQDIGEAGITLKADTQGVTFDAKSIFNGQEHFAKIEATRTAVNIDANIIKHITLNAQLIPEGPTRSVGVTGTWDKEGNAQDIAIGGAFNEQSISGHFKYGDIEQSFKGEITNTGVMIEVHLNPTDVILGKVNYNIGSEILVSASLETPFSSYEKQDATFAFRRESNREFWSQINATWRNEQLIAITTSGAMEMGQHSGQINLDASIICSQEIFGFEHFIFKLEHLITSNNIDINLSGKLDGNEVLRGTMKKTVTIEERHFELSLTTPISEHFSINSHLTKNKGSSEMIYGNQNIVSTYEITKSYYPYECLFKYNFSSTITSDLQTTLTYKQENSRQTLEMQGNYGEYKSMATFDVDKKETADGLSVVVNGRVILPRMAPITGSMTTTFTNRKQIITDIEISRFWSSYGTLKIHSNFNIESFTNVQVIASVISPEMRASVDSMFKLENSNLDSYVKGSYNNLQYSIMANGMIDIPNGKVKVRSTVMTNDTLSLKVGLDYETRDMSHVTVLNLKTAEKNFDIIHELTFSGKYNWEHKLNINDMQFINIMAHVNSVYTHNFDWIFDGKFVRGEVSVEIENQQITNRANIITKLSSSWTQDLTTDLKFESDDILIKPEIMVEYGPDYLLLKTMCSVLPDEVSIKVNLNSSIWQPIFMEGVYKYSASRAMKFSFSNDSKNTTTIDATGIYNNKEKYASVQITSTYLPNDIRIEGGLIKNEAESILTFTLNNSHTYKAKIVYSRLSQKGKLLVEFELPCVHLRQATLNLDYNFEQFPTKLSASMKSDNNFIGCNGIVNRNDASIEFEMSLPNIAVYKASVSYDESIFRVMITDDRQFIEMDGRYRLEKNAGELKCNIKTSISGLENNEIEFMYDLLTAPRVEFKTIIENKTISFRATADVANLNSPRLTVEITTFLDNYKSVGGTVFYNLQTEAKTCEVELYLNAEKITWKLEAVTENNEMLGNGYIILKVTTPFTDYKIIECGLHYTFSMGSYEAQFYKIQHSIRHEYAIKLLMDSRSLSGEILSSSSEWKKITILGQLENNTTKTEGSIHLKINNKSLELIGEIFKDTTNPKLHAQLTTPYETYENIDLDMEYTDIPMGKKFEATMKSRDEIYSLNMLTKQEYKKGEIILSIVTPIVEYTSTGVKANYNFLNDTKLVAFEFEINGKREHIAADLQINNNNIVLKLDTPFQQIGNITLEGDLTYVNGQHTVIANVETGSTVYSVSGEINLIDKYFSIRALIPGNDYRSLEISGKRTETGYLFRFNNSGEEKNVAIDYNLEDYAAYFRLRTPFERYSNILMEYHFEPTLLNASINFEKDDFKFQFVAQTKYSYLKSSFVLSATIPTINKNVMFKASYDCNQNMKIAEIYGMHNSIEQKLMVEARFDKTSAAIKISIPFINEEFGAEYNLYIDSTNKAMGATFTGLYASRTYKFEADAKLDLQNFELKITTPFDDLEMIHIHTSIDYDKKIGKGNFIVGGTKITIDFSYEIDNMSLEIISPYDVMKHFKISSVLTNTAIQKQIFVVGAYNERSYSFKVNYQPVNNEELLLIELNQNGDIYKFATGYEIQERKSHISFNLNTPIARLTDIHFAGKIDTTGDDKAIEIVLQNESDIKMISVQGKFVGDLIDFRIKSPFNGLENFHTSGSLNRSKRSLDFSVMNDSSAGSIRASFNSLNIRVTSPYEALRESSLQIEKTDAGGIEIHYKRGDNHIDITASPTGRRKSFDIVVNSEFPGWEFLAITGRLDQEELNAYLSGQINEQKMTIQGGGTYSRTESNLKYDITTPYEGYESVSVSLVFNVRRKDFNLEITSSSDFHILIKSKPNLSIDIFVPNSAEPTIISANIIIFNGNLSIKSRFPKCRTFNLQYNVAIGRDEVAITSKIEHNGVELFKLDFKRGGGKAHLMIDARRGENHSMLHFHREGFEMIEFIYNRNGKEFKLEAQGSGNLPIRGSIDVLINNSFREVPRTVTAHFEIDRSGSPKKIKLEITLLGSKLYIFESKYNIDLSNPQVGDYKLSITTPTKRAYPWQNMSGSWNLADHDNGEIVLVIASNKYIAQGKFGLTESDIVLTSSTNRVPPINITWRILRRTRDYYFKVGTETRFVMAKLKLGLESGLQLGDIVSAFQSSRFMPNEFKLTENWRWDSSGLSSEGTFEYGQYKGTYNLKRLKREASTRSAVISFEASTNIPDYSKVTVEGEYSFNNEAVLKLDIIWDSDKISIDFNVHDISSDFTEQSAAFKLPGIGDVNVTFGHDFRNKKKRTFTAIGQIMGQESHIKADWNRNRSFTKLSGNVDVQSIYLGHITVVGEYDVRNLNNAKAELKYNRNNDKNVHIKWSRVFNKTGLNAEVLFESHLRTAKIIISANFVEHFVLDILAQHNDRQVKLVLNVEPNSITGEITTPYAGFENITGSLLYNFSDRQKKTATLRYQRGDINVNMDFDLELTSRRAGSLKLNLETPYDLVRTLALDASWKNREGEVHYKRNDIEYNFSGAANVKTDRSSFEMTFTPTSNEPIKLAFSFNEGTLISGTGTEPDDIAKVEIELLGKRIAFEIKGFRSSDRIMLEIDAESSFEELKEFKLKLDSELNTQQREGLLEIKLNDCYFRIKNHFEVKPGDGYYWRSEIDSTVTDLPGLIIGFGKEGEERILTVGTGTDREMTVSFAPKENFKKGFSGKLSLPRCGIIDVAYDVSYSFKGNNILNIDLQIQAEPGKMIEAGIVYNSDGVRARISSPRTGRHSVRARRSVSDNGFFAEVGVDDYNLSLRGDVLNYDLKNGFTIEGEVLGTKISIDSLFHAEDSKYFEGKFIIKTTIEGYENVGGIFTFSNVNNEVHGRAELNLPSYVSSKLFISADIDLNNKIKGLISADISGQVFTLHSDIRDNLQNGYVGQITIRTPFHLASEVLIDGEMKMASLQTMNASFKIDYPLGSKNVMMNYDISQGRMFGEGKINCNFSGKHIYVKLDSSMTNRMLNSEININGNKLNLELEYKQHINGKISILSPHLSAPITVSFSGYVISKDNFALEVTLSFAEQDQYLMIKFGNVENNIEFLSVMNSPHVNGRKLVSLKHSIPESYITDNFDAQISYVDTETYDLIFTVDRNAGFSAIAKLETSRGVSKIQCIHQAGSENTQTNIIIELPNCSHSVLYSMQSHISPFPTFRGTINASIEIKSSFLSNDIKYNIESEISDETKMIEQSLTHDGEHYSIISGYSYTPDAVHVVFEIDTPLFNIGKTGIHAELKMNNIIRTIVKLNYMDETHSFDMKINKAERNMLVVTKSPFIPGEIAKAEASVLGTSLTDISINMAFKLGRKTFAGKMNVNFISLNNMSSTLELKTPFKGYRKMNFASSFKNDDVIHASFFAAKPLGYKFDVKSGKTNEFYITDIDIQTPITGFETVSALVNVPITKTAPKILLKLPTKEYGLDFEVETKEYVKQISGNVNLNGLTYGAGFSLRNKAPYELSYYYRVQTMISRFHIMMDSSVFSVASLWL